MIDIESEVITRIGNAVRKEFASAEISSDETRTPDSVSEHPRLSKTIITATRRLPTAAVMKTVPL